MVKAVKAAEAGGHYSLLLLLPAGASAVVEETNPQTAVKPQQGTAAQGEVSAPTTITEAIKMAKEAVALEERREPSEYPRAAEMYLAVADWLQGTDEGKYRDRVEQYRKHADELTAF